MLNHLKRTVRNWEREGRWPNVTRLATFVWVQLQNAHDRLHIEKIRRALRTSSFPKDVGPAVSEVMTGDAGQAIRPMQVQSELRGLIELVAQRQPRTVLEIGTARGGTLLLLTRFAAPDAKIVSVDLPFGRNGGGYPRWKAPYYADFPSADQTLELIRGDSHAATTLEKVRQAFAGAPVDFILIDADHSYEGVKADFEAYRTLAAPDCVIALHDVLPNEEDPSIDVNRFWRELEQDPDFSTEEIVEDPGQGAYGIGIVRRA